MREGSRRLSGIDSAQLDARVILKSITGFDDAALILRAEDALTADQAQKYFNLIERRAQHEPIAYITGDREFWSMDFHVSPDVLIPRADTECLIEAVLERRAVDQPWSILDLGVGSGCLICALLHEMTFARAVGIDSSLAALNVAKLNAERLGLGSRAKFMAGDWGRAISQTFDIIITNPPYIPVGDRRNMPPDVTKYEPSDALFAGNDGMDAYRDILDDVPRLLAPGGLFVVEAGDGCADALGEMVSAKLPEAAVSVVNDLKGRPRCVIADRKSFAEKD